VLIAGIITLFSALSVAELSVFLPEEGGTYAYAQKLISPFAGFITGWIWVFSNIFVGAAVSLGFAHYFVTLFPVIPVKGIAAIICLIFIFINYIGLKESTILNNLLVTLKVLILLFFIAFGLGFFSSSHITPFAPAGIMGILSGSALIFFAYTGFARVTIMAEEVIDPEKTIPRSIFLALVISTALYILVSVIAVGLVGASGLSQSGSPLAAAIGITGSTTAVVLISLGAMIATASVLLTTLMGISRIMFAMARTGDLPAFLKRIHPQFSTPHYAICISGACIIAAILLADLTLVVAVSTFAMLIFYLIANIAAFRIPLKYRQYPALVPVIGTISCIVLIGFLTISSWIIGIVGLVIGIVWYEVQQRINR